MARTNGKSGVNIANLWGKARDEAKSGGTFGEAIPVDPGRYTMQLVAQDIGDFGGKRSVMLTWAIVGDSDAKGTLCKQWLSLEEERIVWLLRQFASMGVDIDAEEPETEKDLAALFERLIEEKCACAVKVREKDGYTNMYVNERVDLDVEDLVDPEEVMRDAQESSNKSSGGKGGGGGKAKESDSSSNEDEFVEIDVGSRVTWKDKATKKVVAGEIVAFDKDDNPTVRPDGTKKTVSLKLADITLLQESAETEEEEPEAEKPAPKKGMEVQFKADGKTRSGTITSCPPNAEAVTVTTSAGKTFKVNVEDLVMPEPEEGNDEQPEEPVIEPGDVVVVKHKGKKVKGEVVEADDRYVTVKVKGESKPVKYGVNDVAFDTD